MGKRYDFKKDFIVRRATKSENFFKLLVFVFLNFIIFIFNLLSFFINFFINIFKVAILNPLKSVLRFFFYKLVVKIYVRYLSFLKKVGWSRMQGSVVSFVFNQKFVHVVVAITTISLVFVNLAGSGRAESLDERMNKTIMSDFVQSEFGGLEEDRKIVELLDDNSQDVFVAQSYLDNVNVLRDVNTATDNDNANELVADTILGHDSIGLGSLGGIVNTEKTIKPRDKIIEYTVQPGDTVSTIAANYGISVSTILWANNLSAYSLIRPGDKLKILPISGVVHKVKKGENLHYIAKKYKVDEDKIIEANQKVNLAKLKINQEILIPGGRKQYTPRKRSTSQSAIAVIKNMVKPASARPVSNKMNWPTAATIITQYYSWRHHGLDIASRIGTPIYAADSGVVERAGWSRGYGNNIVINHGGGKKTRYAHLSKFYVKKGQRVSKGETIAAMGSTGWSTGPHLHFEVIINGVRYNPLNYIR